MGLRLPRAKCRKRAAIHRVSRGVPSTARATTPQLQTGQLAQPHFWSSGITSHGTQWQALAFAVLGVVPGSARACETVVWRWLRGASRYTYDESDHGARVMAKVLRGFCRQ